MDPQLKEKLQARRLLLDNASPQKDQHAVTSSSSSSSTGAHGALACDKQPQVPSGRASGSSVVTTGTVAALRRAHEVMAARIASPRRSLPKASGATSSEGIAKNDEDAGTDGMAMQEASAAEPIEYLMLELMPLLPAETAERLLRAVQVGENRTLRLQQSAQQLRGRIEDVQRPRSDDDEAARSSDAAGSTPLSNMTSARAQEAERLSRPTTLTPRRCICGCSMRGYGLFSGAWFCTGLLLGFMVVGVSWLAEAWRVTAMAPASHKEISAADTAAVSAPSANSSVLQPAPWRLKLAVRRLRAQERHCQLLRRRRMASRNKLRLQISASTCTTTTTTTNLHHRSQPAAGASRLHAFAAQQRLTLEGLESEIAGLRRDVAACERCAAALGTESRC